MPIDMLDHRHRGSRDSGDQEHVHSSHENCVIQRWRNEMNSEGEADASPSRQPICPSISWIAWSDGRVAKSGLHQVEPYPATFFSAADFFDLDFLAILVAPVGKTPESKETRNVTTVVLTPPPTNILFFTRKPGNSEFFFMKLSRPRLNSHIPTLGVSH